ncbi:annexin A6-like isoform X2 [Mizuhopecten yessoensis]|uniref:annexin A6-like isoform X2 n=1 Tax=Mizuhopecten yessoensis TaxID=6573 RepID=UPI000B45F47E|nr:annexin A6-like isoform X2 [Mizuhopecten yessoensis]
MPGFNTCNKLLQKYEEEKAYRIHKRKIAESRTRLDTKSPKKYPHVIVRLKRIQQEEERQAEVDHENKVLLQKMTHIMKSRPEIDNWNEYEPKSLNYGSREKMLRDIQMQNIGIARRLDRAQPVYKNDDLENEYQQKRYLQALWAENAKEFGQVTPRHLKYRQLKKQHEGEEDEDDFGEEDEPFHHHNVIAKNTTLGLPPINIRYMKDGGGSSSDPYKQGKGQEKLPRLDRKYQDDARSEMTSRSDRSSVVSDKKNPQQAQTDSDAKQLFNASKLIGRVHPEDIIIRTCVRRNQKQRMKTKARFEELYELELIPELKSGLGASWFLVIDALLDDRTTCSARAMHDALEDGNYNTAVEILCLSTPQSLATLNDLYNKDYAVTLEANITDKTEAPEQTLLLALHTGRDESVKVEEKEAEKDADSLYESGDGRWSSDTGPFIKMVCGRNFAHIRVVLNLYQVLTGGKDVTEDIKSECARQYADCLMTMVNCVRGADTYFADKIFKNMSAKDQDFVNMLVARSEIDMPTIKRAYKKKYDAELVDDLKHKCNHPTINVLIELINKIPQGQGKKSKPPVPLGAAKRTTKRPPNAQTKEEEANTPRNPLAAPSQRITAEVVSQRQGQEIAREREREARERENSKGQKKEKEMLKNNISGTVKPSKSFHPDDDCDKLNDALGKYGLDEAQITEILTQRCNVQRQQIKKMYNGKFKQDLEKELGRVLQGDTEEILQGLLQTPAEYDAYSIHEALDGMGIRDGTLIGIIVTRDKQEKKAIADQYKKAYKADVESEIRKEDSGSDFADMLVAVWSGDRETGPVNQAQAKQDANMLLRDGKAVHPKDKTYVDLMVKSSHAQVKATFQEYQKLAGQDIYAGLITAGLGEDEDGYIALAMAVQDPHDFYAEKLNSCFSSMGVNDNMLIRMTVSRSEKDLGDIKARLQDRYKKNLSQLIRSECKGDYKQMLLEVVGE